MQFYRSIVVIATSISFATLSFVPAFAQEGTATLTGRITDPRGLVVSSTRIQAVNVNTNVSSAAETNEFGVYDFPSLPPGLYRVVVYREGFEQIVKPGVDLHVSDIVAINFVLRVGSIAQSLTVESGTPLVSTTTSALGGLVDEQRIADLPLNGRNYNDLTLLQPGVTHITSINTASAGNSGTFYSSNGAPLRSNTYLLDGAILQNQNGMSASSAVGTTLGVDGILEYRVLTNNFSAEYGMSMGSIQTLVSKGGTNQFHGDAFEFLRNSNLDARNYFDLPPATLGHRLPEFRRNNFGGAFGGPIRRNKTFFFGVYERLSQSLGTTNTSSVLQPGCHGGAGAVITLAACPAISPFASVTVAPQIAPILALYPLPNTRTSQYGFVATQPTSENYGQMRVDHSFSNSDTFFTRYTFDQASQTSPFDFPQFGSILASRNQFLTLSENHIFSASLLNTARFSLSRTNYALDVLSGVSGPQYSFVPGQLIGQVNINGLTVIGNNSGAPSIFIQNIFTYSDDLNYTRGRHSLKFGLVINHFQWNLNNPSPARGQVVFPGVPQFLTAQLSNYTVDSPGSILQRHWHFDEMGFYVQDEWRVMPRLTLNLGMRYEPTTTYNEVHGISAAIRNPLTDATTTLGPPFQNPSLRNFSPRIGFAWDVAGNGHTAIRGGFAVLYDLNTVASQMEGNAVFVPPFDASLLVTSGTFTIPYVVPSNAGVTARFSGPVYNLKQPHMLTYNLTAERQLPGSMALSVAYAGSRGINLIHLRDVNGTIPNGVPSNGICVAPPVGTSINTANEVDGQATACYLSNATRPNPNWANLSLAQGGADSFYNAMEVLLNKRLSRGLQLQSSYTWSKVTDDVESGFVNDNAGSTAVYGQDPLHEKTDRGPADFDLTNNWRVNAIYHLPTFTSSTGFVGKIANGWWTSGIYSLLTGTPITAFLGNNRSETGDTSSATPNTRPDVAPGRTNSNITHGVSAGCGTGPTRAQGGTAIAPGTPLGTPTLWWDPCAFTIEPQGFLGNEGRNYMRGPGFDDLDFSIVKDTPVRWLGEGGTVQFRAEFFNLLNHPNFANPNLASSTVFAGTCPGSGTTALAGCGTSAVNPTAAAGTITATNGFSRQIQFGLKILF